MLRKATLVLLLSAHVGVHFAHLVSTAAGIWIARQGWVDEWTARDAIESVVWLIFTAQAALLACWFSFSRRALGGRVLVAAILLALLGVGVFDAIWDQFGAALGVLQTALLGAALTLPAFLVVALALAPLRRSDRWGRWRLRSQAANDSLLLRRGQFRLRDIIGWTFGAALVLGAARWAMPHDAEIGGRLLGWNIYLLLALTGLFFGIHAVPLVWACALPQHRTALAIGVALCLVGALTLAEYYGFAWLGFIVSRYETRLHFCGAAVHAVVFGGTLLILRACGLRVEKEARSD